MSGRLKPEPMPPMGSLVEALCEHPTGVVAAGNAGLFRRIAEELPLKMHAFRSGDTHNGWLVPDDWRVLIVEQGIKGGDIALDVTDPTTLPSDAPVLRITANVLMGGVAIATA